MRLPSRLTVLTFVFTAVIAVSCRNVGTPLSPKVPASRNDHLVPTQTSANASPTAKVSIPALIPAMLPASFLKRLRETSVSIDRIPSIYTTVERGRPAVRMSTGVFTLMDETSILNRKWTPSPAPPPILNVVPNQFQAYVQSNAYLNGEDPTALGVPLPPPLVIHEIPLDMPIRQQSPPRLTCVAYASLAAMEIREDVPNDLSEQYAHHVFLQNLKTPTNCCDDDGVFILDAAQDLKGVGIPMESDFPYTADRPACKGVLGSPCLEDNAHPQALPLFSPRYRVTAVGEIPEGLTDATIGNVGYLESILASGFDIVIEVEIAWVNDKTPEAGNPDKIIDVLLVQDHNNMPLHTGGFHAMLITGYDRTRGFFVARNSMGAGWGLHGGEAWLSYKYITTYSVAGFIIESVVKEP